MKKKNSLSLLLALGIALLGAVMFGGLAAPNFVSAVVTSSSKDGATFLLGMSVFMTVVGFAALILFAQQRGERACHLVAQYDDAGALLKAGTYEIQHCVPLENSDQALLVMKNSTASRPVVLQVYAPDMSQGPNVVTVDYDDTGALKLAYAKQTNVGWQPCEQLRLGGANRFRAVPTC